MADGTEVVVTANPNSPDYGNNTSPEPGFTPQGNQNLNASKAQIVFDSKTHVTNSPDASEDDVVVVGKRLNDTMKSVFINLGVRNGGPLPNIPCVGTLSPAELQSIINNMVMNINNKDYGSGRAGENRVGEGDKAVPVDINKTALLGYDKLDGGLLYIVLHETAHALRAMQTFNNSLWQQYIANEGQGLSEADQKAQYPNSPEFRQNEARANTVAQGIAKSLFNNSWNFTPTNGYETC